jgi:NADH-quinone oxidoreductase subunit G
LDYSNSRGAVEMGLMPDAGGLTWPEMLAAGDLDVLWVVGANPLKDAGLAAADAFVVVQDLFLTETARRADVVLPAASAYEKAGTVTSATGEVQTLRQALQVMGVKADLEIFRLLAREMGLDVDDALGVPALPAPSPDSIRSARDTLFTSGTLGRYSKVLNSVLEAPGGLYR